MNRLLRPTSPRHAPKNVRREEFRWAIAALAPFLATVCFFDYWLYSGVEHSDPTRWQILLRGKGTAPSQYRVGVLKLADVLHRHFPMELRHAFAAIDMVSVFLCILVLLRLLCGSEAFRSGTREFRLICSISFVALVQFYLVWTFWAQRPETLPTALLIALTLLLLSELPNRSASTRGTAVFLMLAVAGLQALVRADAAFALHAGIFFFCFSRRAKELSLPRAMQAATSVAAAALAVGIQFYLMRIAYPHANYGQTPVLQVWANLGNGSRLIPTLLFIPPYAFLAAQSVRRNAQLSAPSLALLVGSGLYFLMWATVGKIDEVRIFLPFALCLAPATALALANAMVATGHVSPVDRPPQQSRN